MRGARGRFAALPGVRGAARRAGRPFGGVRGAGAAFRGGATTPGSASRCWIISFSSAIKWRFCAALLALQVSFPARLWASLYLRPIISVQYVFASILRAV